MGNGGHLLTDLGCNLICKAQCHPVKFRGEFIDKRDHEKYNNIFIILIYLKFKMNYSSLILGVHIRLLLQ